jgi:glutamine amidotransferase-like uncharacterized protein
LHTPSCRHIQQRVNCVAIAALIGILSVAVTACEKTPSDRAAILLFAGAGTSAGDVSAVKKILDDNHLEYASATSSQLNDMTVSQLMSYRLLIVPGGNFMDLGASLTPQTSSKIQAAVQHGVNYLGICAGAFLAGDGRGYYNGFNLTAGTRFGFYSAESRGVRKAAVAIAGINTAPIEQYWEDGPELSGWGTVVAKYPDGTPAVVEGASGKGWVVLSGVHPEAPEAWRRGIKFTTPASVSNAYAGTLVKAALTRTSLPHY